MSEVSRRDFLKVVTLAGTAAAMGCSSESARKLIPFILPPEDIIIGQAAWYATTCRECPAGCGLLAKNREARVVKVEGNPLHPVNQGKLCPRGQASLQGLYNPDRFQGPMKKTSQGRFEPLPWDQAERILASTLQEIVKSGKGERIAFLTDLTTGTLKDLILRWLNEFGSKGYLPYEPLAYESLRQANQLVFGFDGIPTYRLNQADFLISFGADFLETWLSNVEYSWQFTSFHAPDGSGKNQFVYVGPRLSLTAANADYFIHVPPGNEYLVALGMLRIILDENLCPGLSPKEKNGLIPLVQDRPIQVITAKTGVKEQTLKTLAQQFTRARHPLALAGTMGTHPTEAAVAANLLCMLIPGTAQTMDWQNHSALSEIIRARQMRELTEKMKKGEVDLLLIHRANPLFSLPPSWEFDQALKKVPLVVSFTGHRDETGEFAQLLLPTHTPLESWGDYSPRKNVWALMQPVMGPMSNTRHPGDILLSVGRAAAGPQKFPWPNFYQFLRDSWDQKGKSLAPAMDREAFWQEAMKKGGIWEEKDSRPSPLLRRFSGFSFPPPQSEKSPGKEFHFLAYPTIQFFDGRGANRPWLQELPDPITQITWSNWVEIHPQTAADLGIRKGDLLLLRSSSGTIEVPAFPYHGVRPDTLAMPIGQGHTAYGRFAQGQPGNPVHLLSSQLDALSGGMTQATWGVTLEKRGQTLPVANTDGSPYQHGREIAQVVSWETYWKMKKEGHRPHLRLPLPEGYNSTDDFYPAHAHPEFRWVMVVDLDRCIGCGACEIACNAENNVAIVGKEQVLKGREMSWIHVQRYFAPAESKEEPRVQFIPMLCQHCDNAPCESVCPIFAPHHSVEGLNNQIYNRCIGTRFCSQNCPYKVRRFNWFTFTRPEPLNWQLNPDVTVRQKGVMEKCSFCIQRIVAAKVKARSEGRKVRDGEFTTACAQTCPADVFTFGNLIDPDSRVANLIQDPRAYQVLGQLNTKPAVIYLKKLTQTVGAG